MRLLNEQEMRSVVTYNDMITAIEQAFLLYAKEECTMVDRLTARFGKDGMLYMPCKADGVIGTKMLAEFPDNPSKGLPYLSGVMILNNAETGQVEVIMNGQALTALRTGAVGGVAMKYFAPEGARTAGIVGCGVQGLHQAAYAVSTQAVEKLYIYDCNIKDYTQFINRLKDMAERKDFTCIVCESADEVLKNSEIVITATQSREPLFTNNPALFKGKCLIAIGSWQPYMREIPDAIFEAADMIMTDLPFALEESGDLSQPLEAGIIKKEEIQYMGPWLAARQEGKTQFTGHTCYYKSVGMGIFDVVAANAILKKAEEKQIGFTVEW